MDTLWLLALAGFVAGTMNAVAGGGSFIAFPALVAAGLPSVIANASSTVALFPGSLTSSWAYRHALTGFGGLSVRTLLLVSLAGGAAGAVLLLVTPPLLFDRIIPWLLLLATLTFAFGQRAGRALRRRVRIGPGPVLAVQLGLAVYGGYFGGAVGIMMMAVWSLLSDADLKAMNPAKTVMVAATNAVAVLCFAAAGAVRWPETLAMLVGGALGGYGGARLALRLPATAIRATVLAITVVMTATFFWRAYGG